MKIEFNIFGHEFPSSFFTMIILFLGLIIFFVVLNSKIKKLDPMNVKKPSQILIEKFFDFFYNMVSGILGDAAAEQLSPVIMLLFMTIFIGNAVALIGLQEVAYDSSFPIVWGFLMFFVWNGYGIYKIGTKGFLKSFFHPNPAFFPIELMGFFTRLLSIIIRLLGNIASGVVLMMLLWEIPEGIARSSAVLASGSGIILIPLVVVLTFYFSIFAPFIQAYVFSMLSLGNISVLLEGNEVERNQKSLEEMSGEIKEEESKLLEEK